MICKVLERIVKQILQRACIAMTARRLADILHGVVSVDNMTAVCLKMTESGVLERWGDDAFVLKDSSNAAVRNILVTPEYQDLGMTVLRVGERKVVKYIPREAEHRFFEVRQSILGRRAGLGLFLRSSRALRQGTVMCEYTGRLLRRPPKEHEQSIYVVRLRTAAYFVDGVDENGEHLSLATFINDNGPEAANAAMQEYDMLAGRVFVVAARDIDPGEEVFCTYGSTYWGCSSYDELHHKINGGQRKRPRDDDPDEFSCDFFYRCRRCGEEVTKRLMSLHARTCGDKLVKKKLISLNCLPFNEFTAMENSSKVLPASRQRMLRRAKHFVDLEEPQTFGLSHEDVVGDVTFTWSAS
ncbi:SET domain containing protein, putative [Trypanosoma equiperdum]|uniref:SET domain containing protein, putative n=1 Tax=Trypanosoma equiperdum TaxID=5694 RepID=A0A1G4ICN2_TRYEQ|nr:SET domain containing protein, putative [Trypanosoma equiperdum]